MYREIGAKCQVCVELVDIKILTMKELFITGFRGHTIYVVADISLGCRVIYIRLCSLRHPLQSDANGTIHRLHDTLWIGVKILVLGAAACVHDIAARIPVEVGKDDSGNVATVRSPLRV